MVASGPPAVDISAGGDGDTPGEATLLVSAFPPPPFYYTEVDHWTPPEIPKEALERGTRQAAAAAARARAESERLRLAGDDTDTTNAILGGVTTSTEEEDGGEVVGVFGEIVEVSLPVVVLDFYFYFSGLFRVFFAGGGKEG